METTMDKFLEQLMDLGQHRNELMGELLKLRMAMFGEMLVNGGKISDMQVLGVERETMLLNKIIQLDTKNFELIEKEMAKLREKILFKFDVN